MIAKSKFIIANRLADANYDRKREIFIREIDIMKKEYFIINIK